MEKNLATNGIDKPVLNVFRMFGKMTGDRVEVKTETPYDFITVRDESIRKEVRDINALASVDRGKAAIMVWNYHDLNQITSPEEVLLEILSIPATSVQVTEFRIDQANSNSFTMWKAMGSPQNVSPENYKKLEEGSKLKTISANKKVKVKNGHLTLPAKLEGQAVSLFLLEWKN